MDKQYRVVVSSVAKSMLVEHADFLSRVSEAAGDQLVDAYFEAIDKLKELPERNPPWTVPQPEETPEYRKMLFYGRYLLIYEIEGDTVYVEYVVDCRSDNTWLIF